MQVAVSGLYHITLLEAKLSAAIALGLLQHAWEAAAVLQQPDCWRRMAEAAAQQFDVAMSIRH